jgi:hypothetical protein
MIFHIIETGTIWCYFAPETGLTCVYFHETAFGIAHELSKITCV